MRGKASAHPLFETLSSNRICGSTNRPHEGKHENILDLLFKLLHLLRRNLFDFCLEVLCKVAIKKAHTRLRNIVIYGANHFWHVAAQEIAAFVEHIIKQFVERLNDVG